MKLSKFFIFLTTLIIISWLTYLLLIPSLFDKNEVLIPDVLNLNEKEAISKIKQNNLSYKLIYEVSNEFNDTVIKVYPQTNTLVKEKSEVMLYIATLEPITLPDYTGFVYEQTKDEITLFTDKNKIKVNLNFIVNNEYPEGLIMNQNISDENELTNSLLTLDIIKHDNKVIVPQLVGSNMEDVIRELNKLEIKYKVIYKMSFFSFNTIIEQNITPGSEVLKGCNTITLIVSKGLRA